MAVTLEDLAARVEALERAQTATPVSYYTSRYSGEEMDERLDTVGVLGGTPQQALANLGAGVRPSIFDNGDFRAGHIVNQMGITTTSEIGGRLNDRWRLYSGGTVTIVPGGIQMQSALDFGTQVELNKIETGIPYTFSVFTESGECGWATVLFNGSPGETYNLPLGETGIILNVVYDWADSGTFLAAFRGTDIISVVKGEQGESQTLAYQDEEGAWHLLPQPDMDYATQLGKCQFYFEEIPIWTGLSAGDQVGSFDLFVPFKSMKRVVPTVTVSTITDNSVGNAEYYDGASWNTFSVTTQAYSNGFRVFGQAGRSYSPVQFKAVVSAEL